MKEQPMIVMVAAIDEHPGHAASTPAL